MDPVSEPSTYHLIGDVHGCHEQLKELLTKLGYTRPQPMADPHLWEAPPGCQAIFVGDLVDRGPDPIGSLRVLKRMVEEGQARWVMGNHEVRCRQMIRYLLRKNRDPGTLAGGVLPTWVQLLGCETSELQAFLELIDACPCYLELVPDELIVVHARWEPAFAELTRNEMILACAGGETNQDDRVLPDDIFALPEPKESEGRGLVDLDVFAALAKRARWVRRWKGPAWVVWGHQVVRAGQVARVGRTIAVDSGCCLGFALSAYVWPDDEVVQVDGDTLWRDRITTYAPGGGLLFPASPSALRRTVISEGLGDIPSYMAWLVDQMAQIGVPPPWPALAEAHCQLFRRADSLEPGETWSSV